MKITQLPRRALFLLPSSGGIVIPCIKSSDNIIEINSGLASISCFVEEDRGRMTLNLTPENDPFFYEDNAKRITGDTIVFWDGEIAPINWGVI
jgi:hypothetical protein